MYAIASVALVLVALIVATVDGSKAKSGYGWLIAGLLIGEACWLAPLDQQFLFPPGNMSTLVRALASTRPAGLAFAVKALSAFTEPPALWWQRHLAVRYDIGAMIEARPAWFAIAVVVVTALVLLLAVVRLRSRWLAGLAAVSLVADGAVTITFSSLPAGDLDRLNYLVLVMFPVGLLAWFTAGSAVLLTARRLVSARQMTSARQANTAASLEPAVAAPGTSRPVRNWLAACGAAVMAATLIVLASLHDVAQASSYPGAGLNAAQVAFADRLIERALPARRAFALSVVSDVRGVEYRIKMGLLFALTVQGHDPDISGRRPTRPMPRVVVRVAGTRVTVQVIPESRRR
jgi:hypothetical protein